MAKPINLQNIVKHIVNGTFEENLCRICLSPLEDLYEDVFTAVCTENNEYCVADILNKLCHIQLLPVDNYKVCPGCFITASEAFKFYLMAHRSEEILKCYINDMNNQIDSIDEYENLAADSLCITVPQLELNNTEFDFNIDNFPFKSLTEYHELKNHNTIEESLIKIKNERIENEENIVIIMNEKGETSFFRPQPDGALISIDSAKIPEVKVGKRKRKRDPMEYKMCSRCPVRYRFVRKLKEHMKIEHNIDLFVCKVCQAIIEDEQEFNNHLQTHTGIHTCAICNMVFKKRETIIAHFKWHEEMKNMSKQEGAHVCEICGIILQSAEHLKDHNDKKHVKKYTCYYCGRMYKGEISFETHIKKHEINNDVKQDTEKIKKESLKKKRKYTCATCGKDFVDERALLWHERLHTNERPYICDMPLTPGEKMKRYREKLKNDPVRYKEYRAKDLKRVKAKTKKVSEMNDDERDKARHMWREQKKRQNKNKSVKKAKKLNKVYKKLKKTCFL